MRVKVWCGDHGKLKKTNDGKTKANRGSDRLTTWDDDSRCWIELTASPSLDGALFVSELMAAIP